MSTETHIAQYERDIEEAYKKAMAAVGELKDKIEAWKNKAISMSPELRDALNVAEEAAGELEQETKASDTQGADGNKASDQSKAGNSGKS